MLDRLVHRSLIFYQSQISGLYVEILEWFWVRETRKQGKYPCKTKLFYVLETNIVKGKNAVVEYVAKDTDRCKQRRSDT